jgi:hypothetical protein
MIIEDENRSLNSTSGVIGKEKDFDEKKKGGNKCVWKKKITRFARNDENEQACSIP